MNLTAGRTYQIDLEGSDTGRGTLEDPYLWIYDLEAFYQFGLITDDDDGGVGHNSRVTFTADHGGAYYMVADAWNITEGTYTLTVEEVM